eukprot:gb/GEZJ01005506.1/.p1 GENE.gb/GEZJ01005506.1/~~gb/GEZJ01005506.1/.p1  ORF type:complete len:142 (-),score=23.29 gb/GEZJ01005506.1/:1729-2154(-)
MLHQSQGLPSFLTENAYKKKEESFKREVREVPVTKVPKEANIIKSHVFYKVKNCDDDSQVLKARIAPHGNKDKDKLNLKTDSATCPSFGIRMLLSVSVLCKWILANIDSKTAFLQTGDTRRDVYVIPLRECFEIKKFYWLL